MEAAGVQPTAGANSALTAVVYISSTKFYHGPDYIQSGPELNLSSVGV